MHGAYAYHKHMFISQKCSLYAYFTLSVPVYHSSLNWTVFLVEKYISLLIGTVVTIMSYTWFLLVCVNTCILPPRNNSQSRVLHVYDVGLFGLKST